MGGLVWFQLLVLTIGVIGVESIPGKTNHSSSKLFTVESKTENGSTSSPNPKFAWIPAIYRFTFSHVSNDRDVTSKDKHVVNRRNVPVNNEGFVDPQRSTPMSDTRESIWPTDESIPSQDRVYSLVKERKISPKFDHLNNELQTGSEASPYLETIAGVVLGIMIVLLFCFILYANYFREIPTLATTNRHARLENTPTVSSIVEERARNNPVETGLLIASETASATTTQAK